MALIPRTGTEEFLAEILKELQGIRADLANMQAVNVPSISIGSHLEQAMPATTAAEGIVDMQEPAIAAMPKAVKKSKRVKA